MEIRSETNTFLQNKNIVMFAVTFAFILGVIAFYNGLEIQLAAFVTVAMITLLSCQLVPRKFAILAIIMFYLGFFNSSLRIKDFDDIALMAPAELTVSGQIVSIPEDIGTTFKFFVKTDEPSGKILAWINDKQHRFEDLKIGTHITIKGNLRRPGVVSNPSQFDYARYLQNRKVYSIIYAQREDCEILDAKLSPKWVFIQKLNTLRTKILNVHRQNLKSPNIEILGGIVFGDDAVSPPEHVKSSFINSGLLHILAASGMNVAFIWGFWFFFMKRFRVGYKITLISGIILIILYTLMTGLGASVVRAALMLTFVLIGKLFDRDAHSVSLLSFVALLMLIYNPAYLNDIGFQMSFVATLGILTTGQTLHLRMQNIKLPEILKGDVTIPIVAQAWVAPTQMFYFNTFAPYAIFANIAIIPFLCVISFGGFVSSILAIFNPLTKYLCAGLDFIINMFISVVINISNFFSSIPHSLVTTPKPSVAGIIIYYTLLGIITLLIKIGLHKKLLITGLCALILLGFTFIKIPNNNLEIIMFDVQNADCFLIKTPQNDYYIIDTGKFSYTSRIPQAGMIIGKYLKNNGIRKIKALIVTHFDNDHAGGAAYIVENFNVEKVYLSSNQQKTVTAAALFNALEYTKTPFEVIQNTDNLPTNDITIKFLRANINDSDNESSLQTLLTYKDFDALFTGDAGTKAYEEIKTALPQQKIDLLKVGHHGAKNVTSPEMLEFLSPQIALISTGPNRFGHPSKSTLENLRQSNTKIFRTDYDHAVKITTDGNTIKTYTFNSKRRKFTENQTFFAQ